MSHLARPSARRSQSPLILGLLALDFVIGLAPPLHWLAGNGTAVASIGYFLAAGVFITLSLFVMTALDSAGGGDH
ncbi:hypothetical protein OPAG_05243 [Rhodococcus opacus PD630]|jgi:hypothetical protein|uniref:hypothetical protein n=1 Tax=Rhodococcus TaxID=1827 RepID=UPI00029CAF31|nr:MULTISPECIES: hypothetical protein [Rhodococcus]KXF49424.1 hypothetical protein AXA44_24645 [Rhodococcus sp. SC4]AHK31920.1 hypothetical protein Pd630_LPD04707 [Rhodococcus opacus PD630]EHI45212.1 hypothetical protein OPAG_05243 [Rhodococcus opacus PD630]KXX59991.1 hypothetical protein AZG88_39440 [Rhodococcus sp. LB1]UDG94384.1 hypothetical protein K2Z90_004420 [Rhodococcus opacus PD630]